MVVGRICIYRPERATRTDVTGGIKTLPQYPTILTD